jgi:hypothetical protein
MFLAEICGERPFQAVHYELSLIGGMRAGGKPAGAWFAGHEQLG